MFSALMPGLRELRTPLSTGVLWTVSLWMLSLWLQVGDRIVNSPATQRIVGQFQSLGLPAQVWQTIAIVAIYLVGSLLVVRKSPFSWLTSWLQRRRFPHTLRQKVDMLNEGRPARRRRFRPVTWFWGKLAWRGPLPIRHLMRVPMAQPAERFDAWLYSEFDDICATGAVPVSRMAEASCAARPGFNGLYDPKTIRNFPFPGGEEHELYRMFAECFAHEVKQEQGAVELLIQMKLPDLHAEIDRLKVEAEFRFSLFWPLMLLTIVLVFQWSPLSLLLLAVPPLLARDGFRRIRQAADKTWGALMAREVSSPFLDAVKAANPDELRDFATIYAR
ncbi:MAG: hypothetical protein FWD59_10140 [Micrococcales bacterium]|nr:hypothetical protein [Micrococcales bacterium]